MCGEYCADHDISENPFYCFSANLRIIPEVIKSRHALQKQNKLNRNKNNNNKQTKSKNKTKQKQKNKTK